MPHYADGTEAKVGDLVRGKGYNVRGLDGELAEIVGLVHRVNPGANQCNIQVILLQSVRSESIGEMFQYGVPSDIVIIGGAFYRAVIDYGQCDHFNKVG